MLSVLKITGKFRCLLLAGISYWKEKGNQMCRMPFHRDDTITLAQK